MPLKASCGLHCHQYRSELPSWPTGVPNDPRNGGVLALTRVYHDWRWQWKLATELQRKPLSSCKSPTARTKMQKVSTKWAKPCISLPKFVEWVVSYRQAPWIIACRYTTFYTCLVVELLCLYLVDRSDSRETYPLEYSTLKKFPTPCFAMLLQSLFRESWKERPLQWFMCTFS